MILPALLGSTSRPQLKSALLSVAAYNGELSGSFAITPPADAVGKHAFILFAHASRTNSSTGPEAMGTVSLDGYGAMAHVAGSTPNVIVHNPSSMWGYYTTSMAAGARNINWDYYGGGFPVSAAMAAWIIYGRPMTWAWSASRPANGVSVQTIRGDAAYPAAQGYTTEDWTPVTNGNYVRMGRWYGPTAGTHPAGDQILTLSPT